MRSRRRCLLHFFGTNLPLFFKEYLFGFCSGIQGERDVVGGGGVHAAAFGGKGPEENAFFTWPLSPQHPRQFREKYSSKFIHIYIKYNATTISSVEMNCSFRT